MRITKEYKQGRISVAVGDIVSFSGDAIVNAANSTLMGGGGVDGAIHRAGGQAILNECCRLRESRYPDGLPTGEAVASGAGRLPCKAVIHTVGPVWKGGKNDEESLLASCYRNSLSISAERGFKHVGIPSISTGVYDYPKKDAAKVAFKTVSEFLDSSPLPEKVSLVFFSEADSELFIKALQSE